MSTTRHSHDLLLAAAMCALAASAGAQPAAAEAEVRAALARCVEAWNRHDPPSFGTTCLTEDVWFTEADDSWYKRFVGRAKVLGMFDYNIRNTDLQWEVVQVKPQADGTVAVHLKQRAGVLPRTATGYSQSFTSDPSFARLRQDGGAWKVFFFTSAERWARVLLQELDKPATAAAPPAVATADPPTPPGAQPRAYSIQFGVAGGSCFSCHGNKPVVSEDGDRGRIIAAGAAAESAEALRTAMTTTRAGGSMALVLADPQLTDERLDAIRAWLRTLRDGFGERQADRIVIRNQRSDRDPPARLAELRAEGWKLPANAGCRTGRKLAGGAQCEIRLPPGSRGALVFRFAPSQGLDPQPVRLTIAEH
jgi:mono/diheme cytochrome c family protein